LQATEQPLELDKGLRNKLARVYGPRLDQVIEGLGSMGTRFYLRLNTLRGDYESIFSELVSEGLQELEVHDLIRDACFVPVRPSQMEPKGWPVEADKFAAEAILHGAHLYAPGVKKCQGLKAGAETSIVTRDGRHAGNGLARQGEQSILKFRTGLAVEVTENRYGIPSLMDKPAYEKGLFHQQSLPAMVTCYVMDPQPGEMIVDLNCAPGGKLSYLCQLSKNQAKIIGFDRNNSKLEKTQKHLERLGCSNYQLINHDSRYAHEDFTFRADRVIVDPPCTGLGVVPKLGVDMTEADVQNLSNYQRQFLTAASHIVRDGGVIVYSVCTITWEECEGILNHAIDRLGLVLDEACPMVGGRGLDDRGMTQRFDPDIHGTGYFIAKFLKP
jgi:16S rRNA C967 or C1407 C5-methylase (RsmB/RsmF family)